MRISSARPMASLLALSLTACGALDGDDVEPLTAGAQSLDAEPCEGWSLPGATELLSRKGPVEVNYPPFLDVDAPAMKVLTLNINTGELTVWGLETVEQDGVRTRAVEVERSLFALVGGRLSRFPGASALARSVSPDGLYCYDGPRGVLYDVRGVPRNSLTPPLIIRGQSFWDSPTFVSIPPEKAWPGSGGKTDYMVARWLERDVDGKPDRRGADLLPTGLPALAKSGVFLSERYSDYTMHEVPPSTDYSARLPVLACANAILPAGAPEVAQVTGAPNCSAEYLRVQGWPNWSGGCVNLHPTLHWPDVKQLIVDAKADGKPTFLVQSYPGLPQELLIKDDGYVDQLYGVNSPAWYRP